MDGVDVQWIYKKKEESGQECLSCKRRVTQELLTQATKSLRCCLCSPKQDKSILLSTIMPATCFGDNSGGAAN